MNKSFSVVFMALALAFTLSALAGGRECATAQAGTDPQAYIEQLVASARAEAWDGLEVEEHPYWGRDIVVAVEPESPAAVAGFETGDELYELEGEPLGRRDRDERALSELTAQLEPGDEIDYTVLRRGRKVRLSLTLATPPEAVVARRVGAELDVDLARR